MDFPCFFLGFPIQTSTELGDFDPGTGHFPAKRCFFFFGKLGELLPIANPMSVHPPYKRFRKSWGINAMGSDSSKMTWFYGWKLSELMGIYSDIIGVFNMEIWWTQLTHFTLIC